MATQEKTWNVANRLHSQKDSDNPEVNHIIAGADEIYDDAKGEKQSDINAQTDAALADRYTKAETYSKEQLDSMITTPDVEYVSVVANNATTAVTDILPATGEANTIYRVGNWNGTQYDPTMYALFAWDGTTYVCLAVRSFVGEVYDVSVNHPDGQGNPTPYADLTAALGTDGANIPADIRRGGMSIQFIKGNAQSSDNKYVQYRYIETATTAATFTNTANWQGVDDEIKYGSKNLAESGAVKAITGEKTTTKTYSILSNIINDGTQFISSNSTYNSFVIRLVKGQVFKSPIFTNCIIQSFSIYANKPVIGEQVTLSSIDTPYTAVNDCYLMATIKNYTNSASFSYVTKYGIEGEIEDTNLFIEGKACKIIGMGTKGAGNSGVTGVGQVYFNTYNNKLYLCTVFRTITDFDTIEVPFYDGAIYTFQGEFYIWDGNAFKKKTNVTDDEVIAFSSKAVQGGAVFKKIGEKEHTETLVYSDLSGLIYDGTKFVSSSSSYNSFVLHIYKGQTIKFQTFTNCQLQNARVFYVEPKLNVEATSIAFVEGTYTATQNCYIMATITSYNSSASMTYLVKSYGLYKDIEETYINPLSTEQTNIKNKIKYLNDDFSGKTIMCFGDSIQSFYFDDNYNVPNYVAKYSLASVYNAAIGGTRWAPRIGTASFPTTQNGCWNCLDMVNLISAWVDNDFTNVDEAVRLLNTEYDTSSTNITARNRMITALKGKRPSEIDAIIIMCGGNDLTGGTIIGQPDSSTITELYGAMNSVLDAIITANPSIKVYMFGNIVKWVGYASGTGNPSNFSDSYTNSNGNKMEDINNAIRAEAKKYKFPFCDMYDSLGWNMKNFSTYFGQNDGSHPYYGRDVIARKMFAFLAANRLNP